MTHGKFAFAGQRRIPASAPSDEAALKALKKWLVAPQTPSPDEVLVTGAVAVVHLLDGKVIVGGVCFVSPMEVHVRGWGLRETLVIPRSQIVRAALPPQHRYAERRLIVDRQIQGDFLTTTTKTKTESTDP